MATIFISHSSRNKAEAEALRAFLRTSQYTDVFLDFDADDGIRSGQPWTEDLKQAARRSSVWLFLVSKHWTQSRWCQAELAVAVILGKPIVPLLFDPDPGPTTHELATYQIIDWHADQSDGERRLLNSLRNFGQSRGNAAITPGREPYRGLLSFEEEDAPLYFGRAEAIQEGLENLRRMRRAGASRLLLIAGASGSGKSSLLKAGIIPQLWREPEPWIVLAPMRPNQPNCESATDALALSLEKTFARQEVSSPRPRAAIRDAIHADGATALRNFADVLIAASGQQDARILLPIDQLEEAFAPTGHDDRRALLDLLRQASDADPRWFIAATMRADAFPDFLNDGILKCFTRLTIDLTPLPQDLMGEVIRGPAVVAGVTLTDELVESLIEDTETGDALPLLSFALARLWADTRPNAVITQDDYDRLGRGNTTGDNGLIRLITQEASQTLAKLHPSEKEMQAFRNAIIPWLADVNDAGQFIRRPAAWKDLPLESHRLLKALVEARLFVGGTSDGTIEVAHEALLRQWKLVSGWLQSQRSQLQLLRDVNRDAEKWHEAAEEKVPAADGKKSELLVYAGSRLQAARAMAATEQFQKKLNDWANDFLLRCQIRQRNRRLVVSAFVTLSLLLATSIFGGTIWQLRSLAEQKGRLLAERAIVEHDARKYLLAAKLAVLSHAYSSQGSSDMEAIRSQLSTVVSWLSIPLSSLEGTVNSAAFSPDGSRIVTASGDNTARLWDATGKELAVLRGHEEAVHSAVFSPDGSRIVTASWDNTARLWDTAGKELAVLKGHGAPVRSATFSPDGSRIVTASWDNTARLWDAAGKELAVLRGHDVGVVNSAVFSPDGSRIVTASYDNTARLWDATGKELAVLKGHEGTVLSAVFSPDGRRIVTASEDNTARLWDAAGKELAVLKGHEGPVHSAVFSPDGSRIVTASHDGTAWLWDAAGKELGVLKGHEDSVNSAAFSPDGSRIVTVSSDSTARLWSLRSLNADFATDLDIACNFALLKGSAFTGGEVKSLGALLDLPWDRDPCRPYSIAGKFWAQLTGTVPDTPAPPAATPTAETQP